MIESASKRKGAREREGKAVVVNLTISMLNVNPIISNSIPTDLSYAENKPVIVKYGFMTKTDGTDFPLTDFIEIYNGVVYDYKWKRESLW